MFGDAFMSAGMKGSLDIYSELAIVYLVRTVRTCMHIWLMFDWFIIVEVAT